MDLAQIILVIAAVSVLIGTWLDLWIEGKPENEESRDKYKRKIIVKVLTTVFVILGFIFSHNNLIQERIAAAKKQKDDSTTYSKIEESYRSQLEAGKGIYDIKTKAGSIIESLNLLDTSFKKSTRLANDNFINLESQAERLDQNNKSRLNSIKEIIVSTTFEFSTKSESVKAFIQNVINYFDGNDEFKSKMNYERQMIKNGDSTDIKSSVGYEIPFNDHKNAIYFDYKMQLSKNGSVSCLFDRILIRNFECLKRIPELRQYNPNDNDYFSVNNDTISKMEHTFLQYRDLRVRFSKNSFRLTGSSPNFEIDIDLVKQIMLIENISQMQIFNTIGNEITIQKLSGDTIILSTLDQLNPSLVLNPERIRGIRLAYKNETGDGLLDISPSKISRGRDDSGFFVYKSIIK